VFSKRRNSQANYTPMSKRKVADADSDSDEDSKSRRARLADPHESQKQQLEKLVSCWP